MTVDLFGAIPPVIFHSHDLIGDDQLDRGVDGYAFVEPTKNSIWPTIRQGGIYPNFRSINPLAMVETRICIKDDALNTSWLSSLPSTLELTDAIGPTPLCKYLGAYVLQVVSKCEFEIPLSAASFCCSSSFVTTNRTSASLGWPRRRIILAASQDIIHQTV